MKLLEFEYELSAPNKISLDYVKHSLINESIKKQSTTFGKLS